MAQTVLPSQINYAEQLPSLMSGVQNLTQVLNPVNGSTFATDGAQIIIDFPSRGFIDGKSIYFSYNMSMTAGADFPPSIPRCPVYVPFNRLDLYINSSLVESINDYNLIACLWSDLYLGPNEKAGVQNAFGYSNTDGAITKYDSRLLAINANSYKVSGPLVCSMLSSMDKFLPAFACGQVRLVFTLDSLTNMTTFTATAATAFSLSNFQVTYDLIDFGAEVEQAVLQMPQVVIKSSGYLNQSISLPVGTGGNQSFVFNTRLASIRNAVLYSSSVRSADTVNGKFDAVGFASGLNATTTPAFFSLNIGGQTYPQAGPLNTANQSAILMELRKATGSLYDWSKSMSINNVEFAYREGGETDTTALEPAKFFVGFDLNKINSASNAMLNGTSSQNSPIIAQVNFAAATTLAKSLNLTSQYDAILTVDTRSKQISVLM
jgi:hypothetical protein